MRFQSDSNFIRHGQIELHKMFASRKFRSSYDSSIFEKERKNGKNVFHVPLLMMPDTIHLAERFYPQR